MYSEDDLIPISALQHVLFCERQAALIHVERLWAENRLTAEGKVLHEKTHSERVETRGRVRIVRSLLLRSLRLGLFGRSDVVEFTPPDSVTNPAAVFREWGQGKTVDWTAWCITPIEYKRGKPKKDGSDRVQLCAQAICLEEMLGVTIVSGSLFYGQRKRRTTVLFDSPLREQTATAVSRMRELIETGTTPPAIYEPKCDSCSLIELCLPEATTGRRRVRQFLDNQFDKHLEAHGPTTDMSYS